MYRNNHNMLGINKWHLVGFIGMAIIAGVMYYSIEIKGKHGEWLKSHRAEEVAKRGGGSVNR